MERRARRAAPYQRKSFWVRELLTAGAPRVVIAELIGSMPLHIQEEARIENFLWVFFGGQK